MNLLQISRAFPPPFMLLVHVMSKQYQAHHEDQLGNQTPDKPQQATKPVSVSIYVGEGFKGRVGKVEERENTAEGRQERFRRHSMAAR